MFVFAWRQNGHVGAYFNVPQLNRPWNLYAFISQISCPIWRRWKPPLNICTVENKLQMCSVSPIKRIPQSWNTMKFNFLMISLIIFGSVMESIAAETDLDKGEIQSLLWTKMFCLHFETIFRTISGTVGIFYTILVYYSSTLIWAWVFVQKNKKIAKFKQF